MDFREEKSGATIFAPLFFPRLSAGQTWMASISASPRVLTRLSPANLPGEYVHPVARNIEDFLRLLLACYDTAAIEQCWFMDREVFEDFLTRNQPDAEGQKCLDEIRKKYRLTPMEDPIPVYAYSAGGV